MSVSIRVRWIAITLLPTAIVCTLGVRAADPEPMPLLKAAKPKGTQSRIQITASETDPSFYHVTGRVPKSKGNKDEMIDITVALDNRLGKSYITAKKLQSWGYEVPAQKKFTLPELIIPAKQLAPVPTGGRDANLRLRFVRFEVMEPPGKADTVLNCDLLLSMRDITLGSDRAFEPRYYFADHFLELSASNINLIRPSTGSKDAPPEPAISTDRTLMPVVCPTILSREPIIAYASIDGKVRYQLPNGNLENVNVVVSTIMNSEHPMLSMGTARGCGIQVEEGKEEQGLGVGFELEASVGKLKEFRLGLMTGPDLKTQQDLVLKDLKVVIDKHESGHIVFIGPRFIRKHFTDPVYACGTDGIWRLYGRVSPKTVQDIKTRTPEKKP